MGHLGHESCGTEAQLLGIVFLFGVPPGTSSIEASECGAPGSTRPGGTRVFPYVETGGFRVDGQDAHACRKA